MKRYSEKKLYQTTIIRLNKIRFFKNNTAYRFLFFDYQKGMYSFAFCKETDYIKYNGDFNVIYRLDNAVFLMIKLWYQQYNDYKDTYARICNLFDRCELLGELQEA